MTSYTNIQDYTPTSDLTQLYFQNYFNPNQTLSVGTNDIVLSFFELFTGNKQSGALLASAFVQGCIVQNVDPVLAVAEIRNMNSKEQLVYLSIIINNSRVGSSLLGAVAKPQVNNYVARTILPNV